MIKYLIVDFGRFKKRNSKSGKTNKLSKLGSVFEKCFKKIIKGGMGLKELWVENCLKYWL